MKIQNKVNRFWDSDADGEGRLNPRVISAVFKEVCSQASVEGHTPHDGRRAMGRHLIEKTGNIAAVLRQLGHTNAADSIQYAKVTDQELAEALDERWSAQKELVLASSFAIYGSIWISRRVGASAFFCGGVGKDKSAFVGWITSQNDVFGNMGQLFRRPDTKLQFRNIVYFVA